MSEEILKALTQLFAIITKQDGGVTERERVYVINFFKTELDQDTVRNTSRYTMSLLGMEKPKKKMVKRNSHR